MIALAMANAQGEPVAWEIQFAQNRKAFRGLMQPFLLSGRELGSRIGGPFTPENYALYRVPADGVKPSQTPHPQDGSGGRETGRTMNRVTSALTRAIIAKLNHHNEEQRSTNRGAGSRTHTAQHPGSRASQATCKSAEMPQQGLRMPHDLAASGRGKPRQPNGENPSAGADTPRQAIVASFAFFLFSRVDSPQRSGGYSSTSGSAPVRDCASPLPDANVRPVCGIRATPVDDCCGFRFENYFYAITISALGWRPPALGGCRLQSRIQDRCLRQRSEPPRLALPRRRLYRGCEPRDLRRPL